jgi:hypothetical protein
VSVRPARARRATAAVLATAAAVALLAACGSGGHRTTAAPATASAGGGTPGDDAPSEAAGSAASGPKVPDSQLTPPGGGAFSAPEKKYLSGRVPKGEDPVAVLEGGQEVCDRLTRTSAIDPAVAASAVVTGDISLSGATAAVRTLCPDQAYVVTAAAHGFGDGTHPVAARAVAGTSVAPGRYRAPSVSPTCTWRVTGADGTTLASGAAATPAKAVLTLPPAARTVSSSGCYAWLPPITAPAPSASASRSTSPSASPGTSPSPSAAPSGRTS